MSYCFIIENKKVVPTPEILLVNPFKYIWNRDRTVNKETAMKEFAYIEFTTSMLKSNPYAGYSEEQKPDIVKKALGLTNWTPDKHVKDAIKYINEIQKNASPTYSYYLAAKIAAEKMKDFFLTFDINERTDKGMPVYKPSEITNALNNTDKVIASLKALEKKIDQELIADVKTRSNKTISPFAE